jgi:hypothetical protein
MRHLVEMITQARLTDRDECPYPAQAELDAQDREELFRLIAWMRENREDTRLGGENCVDWAIRLIGEKDTWEYGIRFNAMPTGVVMNRKENEDGSVTRTMWQSGGLAMCEQIMRSPAPLSHIKGTKHIVRRRVGPVEAL